MLTSRIESRLSASLRSLVALAGRLLDGEPVAAFEAFGKGYSGDVGVLVGFSLTSGKIIGMGVTTHSETPGIGSKAKEDPGFVDQFKGMDLAGDFKVRGDGGEVDAISGATITSRAVCMAAGQAGKMFGELKGKLAAGKTGAKSATDAKEESNDPDATENQVWGPGPRGSAPVRGHTRGAGRDHR